MGHVEAWVCAAYALGPAVIFFTRYVAGEPLRVILYIVGAFFYLSSILLTACVWRGYVIFVTAGDDIDFPAIAFTVLFIGVQEVLRVFFYRLTKAAYDGLIRLGLSSRLVIPEIQVLAQSSRHALAFICGLGFGTMASFYSVANMIADLSHEGVPGFPVGLGLTNCGIHRSPGDADVPFAYALGAGLLVLFNICWTILLWDSGYKFMKSAKPDYWWHGFVFVVVSHFLDGFLTMYSVDGQHWVVLGVRAGVFLICFVYTLSVVGFEGNVSFLGFLKNSCPRGKLPRLLSRKAKTPRAKGNVNGNGNSDSAPSIESKQRQTGAADSPTTTTSRATLVNENGVIRQPRSAVSASELASRGASSATAIAL